MIRTTNGPEDNDWLSDPTKIPSILRCVGFPEGKITGNELGELLDLAERGVIRILDLEFVVKGRDGGGKRVGLSEVSAR